jgi:hypothetical protein
MPFPIVLSAVLALGVSVAAANSIEGVWSFNGGAVGIQALSDGTFQGTVVTPTRFSECVHPAGEVMWTDMQPQTDGSFWGFHQWYHGAGATCELEPVLGHTAWRVLETAGGVRVLKVCFNSPGGETQPTIAPDGKEANVTYSCVESSPLAPLPKVSEEEGSGKGGIGNGGSGGGSDSGGSGSGSGSGLITFSDTVLLPNAKACISQSSLKIKLRDPKYDPLTEVVVASRSLSSRASSGSKRASPSRNCLPVPTRSAFLPPPCSNSGSPATRLTRAAPRGPGRLGSKAAKNITTTGESSRQISGVHFDRTR